ncbi:hypothetical protein PPYR_08904 [Photinus pyralis]|uniref:Protein eyes shut n=2 Tax=Photinus pyralis TaxID=7054 RepID=A0A5N4AKR9_PHOPY|nr:protein eyes shut [Photinus pyralis]KAB0797911.1 hypothetical protein PPYR_08904 [Photinus pyralis]
MLQRGVNQCLWFLVPIVSLYVYPILGGFNCLSNPCVHGVCIDDLNTSYSCYCIDGYTGVQCQTNWDECWSNPCQNGGVCRDGIATFNCTCPAGFLGEFCEEDYNECASNPCLNNGTCMDVTNGYKCVCPLGYLGDNCEIDVAVCNATNETRCENGGICVEGPGLTYSCACPPGWEGKLCETEIDECMSAPCQNGAVCIDKMADYACACLFGFTGKNCQEQITHCEQNPCQNGALCLSENGQDTCYCVPDFHGDRCQYQYDECELGSRCKNGGTCIDGVDSFTCSCPPNLTGFYCECLVIDGNQLDCNYIATTNTQTTSATETTKTITESFQTTPVPNISIASTSSTPFVEITTSPKTETTPLIVEETTDFPTMESSETTTFHTETPKVRTVTASSVQSSTGSSTETPTYITPTHPPTFLTEDPTTFLPTDLTTSDTTKINATTTQCGHNQTECQNGGSCIYTPEGYTCICPYDAEGPFCEHRLGIKNAAFGGNSYLTHRLVNVSGTDVEFTTKTFSPSGLIFYASIDATYMGLFLERGHLKFIFSCGYQTMLLSELGHPVNDGFEMTIRARLEFDANLSGCNASVMLNKTLTMSGNQVAIVNKLVRPTSILHLGGLPQEKFKEHLPASGFMGCVTDLKVFGRDVQIFKDAEDGYKVSECESLACLSNPCSNGGSCVEDGDRWYCRCKNGYLGNFCESSICDNNPCLYGATCLQFTGNGYICLCPFGRHGHFCENELDASEPYFSGSVRGLSSYASYQLPIGGISNNMEVKFKFRPATMDQIAILLFIGQLGQHDVTSDHVAVSFVKGFIMLTWNLGSGPRRIFTAKPLLSGKPSYVLQFGRVGRKAWLSVDNLGNITGRSPGNLINLDVEPVLYLGGHNSPNFSTLPHDLPLHSGFSGCVYDVEWKSGNLIIPLQSSRQVTGRAVGQCGTNECHERLCQNNGACLHHGSTFTCLCQDGWFGPLCSSRFNPCDYQRHNCSGGSTCVPLLTGYECDCPVGKSGTQCEVDETLSDVSLSGKRSYIMLRQPPFETSKFSFELELRPLSGRGLILFIGYGESSFLSLNMQSNMLELRVLASVKRQFGGGKTVSVRSNKLLAMGDWYKIKVGKYGNKLYLHVGGSVTSGFLSSVEVLSISDGDIYLGGIADMSDLPFAATSSLPVPFTGCIRQFMINSHHIPLTSAFIRDGRNVADCDGTPCGSDACDNGGTCWMDSNLNPHCACPDPYIGEKCQLTPSCEERSCGNRGRCVGTKCFCLMGYTGAFCETGITVHTPDFSGNTHLVLRRVVTDKKRDLNKSKTSYLNLNFSTAEQDGILLWSAKDGNFLGVGIENGNIKLVYSNTYNETIIEMPRRAHLADGSWHSLELNLEPQVEMRIDRKPLHLQHQTEVASNRFPSNAIFYLGGLPRDKNLTSATYGLFKQPFVGCIGAIQFNKEKLIQDFSVYEGENVGVCNNL